MPIESSPQIIEVNTTPQIIEIEVIKKEITVNSGGSYNFNFAGSLDRELLTITSNNQTTFLLSNTVEIVDKSQLFLNGVKQVYGVDYNIDNSITTLFWFGISLELNDYLEIYY
jgi:hypothetical protein